MSGKRAFELAAQELRATIAKIAPNKIVHLCLPPEPRRGRTERVT